LVHWSLLAARRRCFCHHDHRDSAHTSGHRNGKAVGVPFGKEVVHVRELDGRGVDGVTAVTGTIGIIFNVLWAVTFGVVLCLSYILGGILCCLTLIGIPFGLQTFKLAGISLWPVGRRVVSIELADVARRNNAAEAFDRRRQGRVEPT
jgi:uncharacterized membrane protein YccF (DUF307 family)